MEEEDDHVKKRNKRIKGCNEDTDASIVNKESRPLPMENGVFKKVLVKNKDLLCPDEDVSFGAIKRIKLFSDDSSVDTAETIKKIQAFIALGKSDDFNKDSESLDKQMIPKPSPKNIIEHNENLDESGEVLVNNISELQRTLQGLDDSQDYSDHSLSGKDGKTLKKELSLATLKENNRDVKSSELNLVNDVHTPSRVSKRIQSKSVKFSARKMLKGDDTAVLKRMIPGYQKEKILRKDRVPTKGNKGGELRKIQILGTTLPPEDEVFSETESIKPESLPEDVTNSDKLDSSANPLNTFSNNTCNSPKSNLSSQTFSPSSPEKTNLSSSPEHKEKLAGLADQLDKFAVTNGKITLELKTAQQKKVVRIAVPPKASSPLVKTSLGPDIIIKRVKPVKKPTASSENLKETSKISEKNLERKIQDASHHLIQISPRLDIEELPVKKFKEDIVKIQKNIIKSGKTDEIKSSVMSVKYVNLQKPLNDSISDLKTVLLNEDGHSKTDKNKGEVSNDEPSLTKQIAEALENTPLKTLREESALKRFPEKSTRGRKPSKSNFWGSKFKSDIKKTGKSKREDVERSPSVSDIEDLPGEPEEKGEFKTLFDRYFITSERYIEHHDSLDSDSSSGFDSEVYTHFINLKHNKNEKKQGEATVYDLMHDISIELPTWNIHAASNGEMFYLVQIDSSDDKPLMKKVVELDLDNNAKVYIDDKLVPRYEGNYSSYEDIRQLIYDIDRL